MSIHDSVKICQILEHSFICTEKKKAIYLVMYSIIAQVAQSRHQLIEYLLWKDRCNRRLFTIFRKLRSWREKNSLKWSCRINGGGHVCLREAIEYEYIGSGIEYYVLSQSTYKCLTQDFQPPIMSTITKMTSKVKKIVQSFFIYLIW